MTCNVKYLFPTNTSKHTKPSCAKRGLMYINATLLCVMLCMSYAKSLWGLEGVGFSFRFSRIGLHTQWHFGKLPVISYLSFSMCGIPADSLSQDLNLSVASLSQHISLLWSHAGGYNDFNPLCWKHQMKQFQNQHLGLLREHYNTF